MADGESDDVVVGEADPVGGGAAAGGMEAIAVGVRSAVVVGVAERLRIADCVTLDVADPLGLAEGEMVGVAVWCVVGDTDGEDVDVMDDRVVRDLDGVGVTAALRLAEVDVRGDPLADAETVELDVCDGIGLAVRLPVMVRVGVVVAVIDFVGIVVRVATVLIVAALDGEGERETVGLAVLDRLVDPDLVARGLADDVREADEVGVMVRVGAVETDGRALTVVVRDCVEVRVADAEPVAVRDCVGVRVDVTV